jgi:hypothetical protein
MVYIYNNNIKVAIQNLLLGLLVLINEMTEAKMVLSAYIVELFTNYCVSVIIQLKNRPLKIHEKMKQSNYLNDPVASIIYCIIIY